MFININNIHDLSKDYNMMLDKTIIDCFEEIPISQTVLNNIIQNYNNIEQDNNTEQDNNIKQNNNINQDNNKQYYNNTNQDYNNLSSHSMYLRFDRFNRYNHNK